MLLRLLCHKYKLSITTYILVSSLFIVAIYNIPSISTKLIMNTHYISMVEAVLLILSEVLLLIVGVAVLLFIFSFSKLILKLLVGILIIVSSICCYYIWANKIFLDDLMIATVFETPLTEAGKAINSYLFGFIILLGIMPTIYFLYNIRINKCSLKYEYKRIVKSFCIFLGILSVFLLVSFSINHKIFSDKDVLKASLANYIPVNYIAGMYQYFAIIKGIAKITYDTDISKKYPFIFVDNKLKNEEYTVILVIGESSRADHYSLNGYARNTNPYLSKVKKLINFPRAYSCGTYTAYSLLCLLSHKSHADFRMSIKDTNLISAFNSLGFTTYYFSTQPLYNELSYMEFAVRDSQIYMFANQIRAKVPSNSRVYDEYLLDFVKEVNNKGKKLIILQLMTSHTLYSKRYPDKFAISKGDNIIDQYDNTIVYTDYILNRLIDMYKKQKTFIYFVSDHGESLGENGMTLHGAQYEVAPIEQIHIPQMIWASDQMIKLMGERYKNIYKNRNNKVSHDNLFHSLFDCLGIESAIVNKKLSLCRSYK